MSVIKVSNLKKYYKVHKKQPGILGSVKSLIKRESYFVNAVDDISLILTSHYMEDVKELCNRVIIIGKGKIAYDGNLSDVVRKYADHKVVSLILKEKVEKKILNSYGTVKKMQYPKVSYLVPREKVDQFAVKIIPKLPIADLNIQDPDLEDIVREIFTGEDVA